MYPCLLSQHQAPEFTVPFCVTVQMFSSTFAAAAAAAAAYVEQIEFKDTCRKVSAISYLHQKDTRE